MGCASKAHPIFNANSQWLMAMSQSLERQVIVAFSAKGRHRSSLGSRSGSRITDRRERCGLGSSADATLSSRNHSSRRIIGGYLPSANLIIPTSIVFAGIDVEAHRQLLPNLNIELSNAVRTKHFEGALLGELLHGLKQISCYFPLVA